ncbi:MAG: DEAD/DEAH box helicase [Treponema sp.]|jgi:superfamily II DNA or RNA helicase|nr:DEAD/DEAH box helicase [Treponema sp.]
MSEEKPKPGRGGVEKTAPGTETNSSGLEAAGDRESNSGVLSGTRFLSGMHRKSGRTGKEGFYFIIGREGSRAFFRFHNLNPRNARQIPDFRRFTGVSRELLRGFLARKHASEYAYTIDLERTGNDGYTLMNPDERLIEQALTAGLLRNTQGEILQYPEGSYRCALRIEDLAAAYVDVSLVLQDSDGTILAEARKPELKKNALPDEPAATGAGPSFYTLSPCFALAGDLVYPIEDLGPHWAETDRVYSRVQKNELPAFLSLIRSRFSNLELLYEGWSIRRIRPAAALPALLFMEIDRYGYLHVRPIGVLRGFPPLFLENEDIVTVVEMDEADKVLGIAEVIFPEPPGDLFRTLLSRGYKGTFGNSVYEENGRFIIAPEFAGRFLEEHILDLSRVFVLLETQVLRGYKLRFSAPRIRLSMGKGIDYLAGNAVVEFEGQSFSFARFMAEYRKAACITLADGSRGFPDKSAMDRLERLVSQIKGRKEEVELSYYDVPLVLQDDSIEVEGAAWEEARLFFTRYNTIQDRPGTWSLANGSLRPYQEYGVRWLDYLREHRMGACLADEMGLGKTVQVIALLRSLFTSGAQGACLILCPKTLVVNWTAELDRFAPELPYTVHYGSGRDSADLEERGFRLILSTYGTLRRDAAEFQGIEFLYIILDESQNIKNLTTRTASAALSLRAVHRLAMSGTPVENNLGELYSLFRFLNPNFFGSEQFFNRRYLHPIQDNRDEDALRDLRARIYPFMLRRLKRDVLKDLPDKTEETAYIELEEPHLAVYHRRRQEYKRIIDGIISGGTYLKASFIVFKALTDLRRLASVPEADGEYGGPSAKRQYLKNMIPELVENGHKCLIFTNFLATVGLVSEDLAAMGIPNLTMTGATTNRRSLVHRFQTDNQVKAFIMTLKTGGIGLNLTAADYIFILDPWWNSAAETQAIDRGHRIGQVNPVFCYRLIAKDTIEERIMELQKRKTDLAGALLSDDAGALKALSPEDAAYLVGDSYES